MSRFILRVLAAVLFALFILPVFVGLLGTVFPAIGQAPSIASGHGFSDILSDPRFQPALLLSVKTGAIATVLVLVLTTLTLVCLQGTRLWRMFSALLPPQLALPHAAIAVGLVFLISPSGALVRLISPELSGWDRPPQAWVVPDVGGWSLILGLIVKEMPFLLVAAVAQLSMLNVEDSLRIGKTLGYAPARCWSRLILPRLYPRIRLTVLIILAFNLTVVDMALVLGPGNPPTLSVFLMELVNDPGSRAAASAGALLLALLVIVSFIVVLILEHVVAAVARRRRQSGARGRGFVLFRFIGKYFVVNVLFASIGSLILLVIWSFTRRWRFPESLPSEWTLVNWTSRADVLMQPAQNTVCIAFAVTVISMVSVVLWLELERISIAPSIDGIWFLPLFVPQVSLLFGWQAVALWAGVDGQWWLVVYTHYLYTFPFVILVFSMSWRELDPMWGHAAHTLGAGYWRVLWTIRLPLLRRPLYHAAAVSVAVSVAQYLPTLLMGAGRHPTLTTELVTSLGGVDRRVIATLAVLQSALPLAAFVAALLYPKWRSQRVGRLDHVDISLKSTKQPVR